MNIDETIAELQRLRDFINPSAEIVGEIRLNPASFISVEVKSLAETSSSKHPPLYD